MHCSTQLDSGRLKNASNRRLLSHEVLYPQRRPFSNPGWSSIDSSGILIDLGKMRQIEISADKKVISLGLAGRWGDVIETLDPHGLSVIGGRIPQVGVAGLILGGLTKLNHNSSMRAN